MFKAFNKSLRNQEQLLGETKTDDNGFYEISYHFDQFYGKIKDHPDLIVRAFIPDKPEIETFSSLIYNAKQEETVDLIIGNEKYKNKVKVDMIPDGIHNFNLERRVYARRAERKSLRFIMRRIHAKKLKDRWTSIRKNN